MDIVIDIEAKNIYFLKFCMSTRIILKLLYRFWRNLTRRQLILWINVGYFYPITKRGSLGYGMKEKLCTKIAKHQNIKTKMNTYL